MHLVETVAICTWTEIGLPTTGTHAQQWLEYYATSSGTWSLSGGGLLQVGLSRNIAAHKHLKERNAICSVIPFCVLWTGWVLGTYLEVSLALSFSDLQTVLVIWVFKPCPSFPWDIGRCDPVTHQLQGFTHHPGQSHLSRLHGQYRLISMTSHPQPVFLEGCQS